MLLRLSFARFSRVAGSSLFSGRQCAIAGRLNTLSFFLAQLTYLTLMFKLPTSLYANLRRTRVTEISNGIAIDCTCTCIYVRDQALISRVPSVCQFHFKLSTLTRSHYSHFVQVEINVNWYLYLDINLLWWCMYQKEIQFVSK